MFFLFSCLFAGCSLPVEELSYLTTTTTTSTMIEICTTTTTTSSSSMTGTTGATEILTNTTAKLSTSTTTTIKEIKKKAGIQLSFDDCNIDEWCAAKDFFATYEAKVTFFVTYFDSLSDNEITKLKLLYQASHEVACHGMHHLNGPNYLTSHSLNEYIDSEIVSEINLMVSKGFFPESFAYPYGAESPTLEAELLKYFKVVRGISSTPLTMDPPPRPWYYNFDGRIIYGMGIDASHTIATDEVIKGLQYTLENDCVMILRGHHIGFIGVGATTTYSLLDVIFKFVNDNQMNFYRASDLQPLK
jgi:hypothetical protein